jgi:uncharacterized protein YidB (DUF937 family)
VEVPTGLLDQLTGLLKGGSADDLLGSINQFIGNEGGFGNLLEKFKASGQGDKVDSWVSTGENKAISPDEVKAALGDESISRVAGNLGVSEDEAAAQLSKTLPDVVDQATPDGSIPSEDQVTANLSKALSGS